MWRRPSAHANCQCPLSQRLQHRRSQRTKCCQTRFCLSAKIKEYCIATRQARRKMARANWRSPPRRARSAPPGHCHRLPLVVRHSFLLTSLSQVVCCPAKYLMQWPWAIAVRALRDVEHDGCLLGWRYIPCRKCFDIWTGGRVHDGAGYFSTCANNDRRLKLNDHLEHLGAETNPGPRNFARAKNTPRLHPEKGNKEADRSNSKRPIFADKLDRVLDQLVRQWWARCQH